MIPDSLYDFVADLDKNDWFCDAELDSLGRFVVYVNKMDLSFISRTPDRIAGYHVLFHFDRSQPQAAPKTEYEELTDADIIEVMPYPDFLPEDIDYMMIDSMDISKLGTELDSLEKICGSNMLQDIFYEIHDGKNAITNLSARFPEIRRKMNLLYDTYGFDVIYNELDG